MIIQQKYIRKVDSHLHMVKKGQKVVVGVRDIQRFQNMLQEIGFPEKYVRGESILPSTKFGPANRYNATGKNIVRRDLPKETCYRMAEWHWKEFRGRDETEEMSKIVFVPYERYPREFIKPPSVELTLTTNPDNDWLLVTPAISYVDEKFEALTHTINMVLEIFGECEILTENLESLFQAPIRRLNWHILPPGEYPWEKLQEELNPIIKQARSGNQNVVTNRLETINRYKPEFIALGNGGFREYVVFGFPSKNLFILESPQVNNATYLFGDDWESLSQKTKAEILSEDLQKGRILHQSGWYEKISALFD